jgi:hypothetical protein
MLGIFAASASAQATWTTVPAWGELRSIVYGDSEFVVVGAGGIVLTSPNGATWTIQTSGTTRELYSVAWGDNLFVAVGDSGTILTSSNGTSWKVYSAGTANWLHGVLWADNQFIAVGGNGTVVTSPDGIAWTSRASGTTSDFLGITFGGASGKFVAVGGYLSPAIFTSSNGIAWAGVTTSATPYMLNEVAWNGTSFVAIGDSGAIITSADGSTWTSQVSGTTGTLADVIWAAGQFVIVGHEGIGVFGPILTSPTGITWTARTSSTTQWLYGVTWGNSLFVAVGTEGTIITSPATQSGVLSALPSPFKRAAVRIEGDHADYALASAGHVSMRLFDFQGRLVDVLLDADQPAGAYSRSIRPAGANRSFGKYILSFKTGGTSLDRPVFLGQ